MPSSRTRYEARRQGSSDSHRSHRSRPRRKDSSDSYRRPRRKGSSDSTRSHRSRHSYDRRGKASAREEDIPNFTNDLPPSYEASEANAAKQNADRKEDKLDKHKPMSPESRVFWGVVLTLPLLASVLLLFLITASSSSLRTDFSVIKISVDGSTLDGLITAAKQAETQSANATSSSGASLDAVVGRATGGGYLTLGIWGWCAASSDSSKSACSPSSGWYSVEDDLGNGVGSIPGDAFNTVLVYTLILHGLALLASMLAVVPVGLYVWRRYYHADEQVEGGWFQHGTILAAAVLALCAWIFDKVLLSSIKDTLPPDDVQYGPAVALVGCSIILLFVSFSSSTLPVFGRFARYKLSYAKGWRDLEEASDGAELARQAQDAEMGRDDGGEVVKRKRKGRTRRRMRDRMTRMFA